MAHTAQERYSKLVDIRARKELVTKDSVIFNTRYEGNPTAGAVKIPVRAEVSVKDYNKATGINGEVGTTTYITATVDNDKAVNEIIDGFDAASVPDNLVADRLDSAGYSLSDTLDADGISVLATEGTELTDTTASTVETIYEDLVDVGVEMSTAKVPVTRRWLIVSPAIHGLLLKDTTNFIRQSDLSQKLVEDGAIGKVAGFVVYQSNNLPAGVEYIAGHPDFATRVDEWAVPVKVVDLSGSGKYIGASAVQGRKVYTHKVTNKSAILVKKVVGA